MQRLFSGVQPSGNLHLGNYLGAIKQWVELQDNYEAIFCVVDLHAITVPQDPAELRRKIIEIAKIYLAAGIDPKKSTIFVQSQVPAHAELAWVLNTIATMGELGRMTQFKDKMQKSGVDNSSVGLFDYPVLMAADILLYDTAVVPVGEDQKQHVELTRDLAERFNKRFGETFVVPEPLISGSAPARNATHSVAGGRIMGLDDPTRKMSKSASSEYNYLALMDDPDTVRRKIMKAVTDSGSEIEYTESKPALRNLLNIYSLLENTQPEAIAPRYTGQGYADFKKDLAEVVVSFLTPFQERLRTLSDEEVLRILTEGREKVKPLAEEKIRTVYERVGLLTI